MLRPDPRGTQAFVRRAAVTLSTPRPHETLSCILCAATIRASMLPMATRQGIFHKTDYGRQAHVRVDSSLPQDYRMVLEAVQQATPFGAVRACLPHRSPAQVAGYLEDLEAIGLIDSVSMDWVRALYEL
jgi:hypothetical protein